MAATLGKSIQDIIKEVKAFAVPKVKLAVTDIDGVLRGKVIHRDKFLSAMESGLGFCDVVFGWDAADKLYEGAQFTGWHTGFPDAQARIDPSTFRRVPWDGDIPFFLADFSRADGEGLEVCPRTLLARIAKKATEMNYLPNFAAEYEFFNFKADQLKLDGTHAQTPVPITSGMFGYSLMRASENSAYFNDLFDLLARFDVPLEALHTETGPGVYEAALLYAPVREAADRATLFKAAAKEIGRKHGIIPSFMARWSNDFPGCSGHLHQSLWDKTGQKNLFFDAKRPDKMSELMKHYLAGILACLPALMPMYAPTTNSYKRLVEGAWAPTNLTWGIDNRTTAVRALLGSEKATRLEMRVTGSDINPYLAIAACLASGLYGIENKLALKTEPVLGNGYAEKGAGKLPSSLEAATAAMQKSDLARELIGDAFVNHFCQTRLWECQEAGKAVTDWELKRYFEVI